MFVALEVFMIGGIYILFKIKADFLSPTLERIHPSNYNPERFYR
jgi:hypothetical protein